MKLLSVIIPTHNRKASLHRMLDTLALQTLPASAFEVIVVADGCVDGTIEFLQHYSSSYQLLFTEQAGQGPGKARNKGAQKATSDLLLFLDDDIEPCNKLLEAHVAAHETDADRIVIGYLPPVLSTQKGFYRLVLKDWWEEMFSRMEARGHRFSYRNILSGNLSLSKELFLHVGGFKTNLPCQEDYELGLRLMHAGAKLHFEKKAWGYHHEKTQLDRTLKRMVSEGEAAVEFCRMYPEIIHSLPILNLYIFYISRKSRMGFWLMKNAPFIMDLFISFTKMKMHVAERLKMRGIWGRSLDILISYHHLRGITNRIKNFDELKVMIKRSLQVCEQEPCLKLDMMDGINRMEQQLLEHGASRIELYCGTQFIGKSDYSGGMEAISPQHLRWLLVHKFASKLIQQIQPGQQERFLKEQLDFPDLLKSNSSLSSIHEETVQH